ncbi:MAG: hypothetical protein GY874_16355, partial [Desulfobacteraceae bacterium]|nr:hypothetical protein [Desulfobacteraceae bacterium]
KSAIAPSIRVMALVSLLIASAPTFAYRHLANVLANVNFSYFANFGQSQRRYQAALFFFKLQTALISDIKEFARKIVNQKILFSSTRDACQIDYLPTIRSSILAKIKIYYFHFTLQA